MPVLPLFVPVTVCAPGQRGGTASRPCRTRSGRSRRSSRRSRRRASYRTGRGPRPCRPANRPARSSPRRARARGGRAPPAVTLSEAVPVFPSSLPVTVCGPASGRGAHVAGTRAVWGNRERRRRGHVAERVDRTHRNPRPCKPANRPRRSTRSAGVITMWSSVGVLTLERRRGALAPESCPVTVCAPGGARGAARAGARAVGSDREGRRGRHVAERVVRSASKPSAV